MQKDSSRIISNSIESVGEQEKKFKSFISTQMKALEDRMDKKLNDKIEDVKK